MEARHTAVVGRLKAREAERLAEAAKRHDAEEAAGLETESTSAFLDDFNRRRSLLEADIDAYASVAADKRAAHDLASQVAELEQFVASAAYFLPSYDLRAASQAVATLKERLEAATLAQQPRKKFSFLKKPALAAPIDKPDAGLPTTTTTTAPTPTASASSGRTISGLRNQTVTFTSVDISNSEDVTLSDLQDCIVHLLCPLGALFIHRLANCTVVAGPVGGALHVEGIENSRIYVAARQARIHSATGSGFYLRVKSGPIIEHSSGLQFAPLLDLGYPEAQDHLAAQGLDPDGGQWADVQDFGWLRASASPNWRVLPEKDRQRQAVPLPARP